MENSNTCVHSEYCGGCCYRGVDYKDQLKNKAGEIRAYLKENDLNPELLIGIKPCPIVDAYRNKMEYTFGDAVKGGELNLGMHQKGNYINIHNVLLCKIVPPDFNVIVENTLNFCREREYKHFHRITHKGLLRNLVIRKGIRTNQLIINIITTSDGEFDEDAYVSLFTSLDLDAEIKGIIHTVSDVVSDAYVPEKVKILYGRDYYDEEILGLKFKVRAFSFFQTNVLAAERLYKDAVNLIEDLDGKTVYDLYCGTGTITQAMALKAKKAIGVEIVEEAIETAKESAKINGLSNCEFYAEDVNTALSKIADKPDVIVVDPPRSGIVPKAMKQILSYGVNQLIYISCNPKTMAVNLKMAQDEGYTINSITAYDNFPYTKHCECIAKLTR